MITVFGHKGFIGSQVVRELNSRALDVYLPDRDEDVSGKDLGKIIYCIGLTADAKRLPFDTIHAHINKLATIIRETRYTDITYSSSTRLYVHNTDAVNEESHIQVDVSDPFELFNLTKLTAESLLLNTVDNFKSVRYSNVYGTDLESENFITSVLKEIVLTGAVKLYTSPDSAKDYISVNDAARLTVDIALTGKHRIYNIASGINTSNKEILDKIAELLPCRISYDENAKTIIFPPISIDRVRTEFGFHPSSRLVDDISVLVSTFAKKLK